MSRRRASSLYTTFRRRKSDRIPLTEFSFVAGNVATNATRGEKTKRKKNREWRRDSTRERGEGWARYSGRGARAVLIKWLRFCAARVFQGSAPIQAGLKERVHLADGDRRTYVSAGNDYHVESDETRRDAARREMWIERWPTEEQASSSAGLNADIVESRVRWSYWTRRLSVFHSAGNFARSSARSLRTRRAVIRTNRKNNATAADMESRFDAQFISCNKPAALSLCPLLLLN